MSAESLELKLRRGTRLMESLVGPVDWAAQKTFGFHRHRDREQPRRERPMRYAWDIWLHIGPAGLNLSCQGVAPAPRSLDEARAWAIAFASEHGFEALQRERPRPRPRLRLVCGGADK